MVRSMYDSGPRPDKVLLDSSDNFFYLFLYKLSQLQYIGLCVLVLYCRGELVCLILFICFSFAYWLNGNNFYYHWIPIRFFLSSLDISLKNDVS